MVNFLEKPKKGSAVQLQLCKTKLCVFHLQGKCRAAHCKFAHALDELQQKPDLSKTRLCTDFIAGSCTRKNCSFAHGVDELTTTNGVYKTQLCIFHARGFCKKAEFCRHAHGTTDLRPSSNQTSRKMASIQPNFNKIAMEMDTAPDGGLVSRELSDSTNQHPGRTSGSPRLVDADFGKDHPAPQTPHKMNGPPPGLDPIPAYSSLPSTPVPVPSSLMPSSLHLMHMANYQMANQSYWGHHFPVPYSMHTPVRDMKEMHARTPSTEPSTRRSPVPEGNYDYIREHPPVKLDMEHAASFTSPIQYRDEKTCDSPSRLVDTMVNFIL